MKGILVSVDDDGQLLREIVEISERQLKVLRAVGRTHQVDAKEQKDMRKIPEKYNLYV